MSELEDYTPFGEEWMKEMKSKPKTFLVDMLKKALTDNLMMQQDKELEVQATEQQEECSLENVSCRIWHVVELRGQIYHTIKKYKRKQDAQMLLIKEKKRGINVHLVSDNYGN